MIAIRLHQEAPAPYFQAPQGASDERLQADATI